VDHEYDGGCENIKTYIKKLKFRLSIYEKIKDIYCPKVGLTSLDGDPPKDEPVDPCLKAKQNISETESELALAESTLELCESGTTLGHAGFLRITDDDISTLPLRRSAPAAYFGPNKSSENSR